MTASAPATAAVPSARIDIVERGTRSRSCDYACVIGRDLTISPDLLSRYCLRDLEPAVDDLVLLAGAVAFADRVVPRRPSVAWRRNLEVVIPVHTPDSWQRPELLHRLTSVLDHLTGDIWVVKFKSRKRGINVKPQARLPLGGEVPFVMPYSDGLDSFVTAQLMSARHPNVPLILVTTGKRGTQSLVGRNADLGRLLYSVSVPFRLSPRSARFREPSYRSRAFVFGVMAGIAAHLLHAGHVFVPENGQGSLGPWLMPVGNEAPDVRMHPSFTARLADLLKLILGCHFSHDHPHLWKTKGESLNELKHLGLADRWWLTTSCARDARHVALNNRRVQCGVCTSCLLRRQSLFAADLDEKQERYLWSDLSAPELGRATQAGSRATSNNDERQAYCAVLELQQFADMLADTSISAASAELASVLNEPAPNVEAKVRRLIGAHRDEWNAYLSNLGPGSFIRKWLEGMR